MHSSWKKLWTRIHKPWIHATLGSALIILSTLATGYRGYQNQSEADALRAEVRHLQQQIDQSVRRRDMSSLVATLASIYRATVQTQRQDKRLRSALDNVFTANLYEAAVRMAEAADNHDSAAMEALLKSRERALQGDPAGVHEIYNHFQIFLRGSGAYQQSLRLKIAKGEATLGLLDRKRNMLYFGSLVLQVIGLVFLLLKEVPAKGRP